MCDLGGQHGGLADTSPNQALEPTPTAFARPSLRLLARLTASVAMTSNVKSWQQLFLGLHDVFYPSCIRRAGASKNDG
jgi:hypothetical protein